MGCSLDGFGKKRLRSTSWLALQSENQTKAETGINCPLVSGPVLSIYIYYFKISLLVSFEEGFLF